jgi:hypothetical protein
MSKRLGGGVEFDTVRWRRFMPRCDMHPTATGRGCMLPSKYVGYLEYRWRIVTFRLRMDDAMHVGCTLPQGSLQPTTSVRISACVV